MNSMLKTLLKKQFMSIINGFGQNKKKRTKNASSYLIIVLIVSVFMGIGFFQVFNEMGKVLFKNGLSWLLLAYAGLMAFAWSVLGSVFMAVSQLYEAKDNDLLLSLPIPPRYILFVRMVPLYVQNLVFSSVILIPSFISRCINGSQTALQVILYLCMFFAIPLFSLFVTCLLGLLISFLTSKVRDKSLITVIFSFVFSLAFVFLYSYANSNLTTLIQNSIVIGNGIEKSFYPLYSFGKALDGNIVHFAVFFSIIILLFAGLYAVLSKTYIKLITTKRGNTKKNAKKQALKSSSPFSTLFKKELKRFFGTAIYMLNGGFGDIFLVVLLIAFLVKSDYFVSVISQFMSVQYLPAILLVGICLISSLNCVSAPSISLEGKNLWILQSLPIDLFNVLLAKLVLHFVVTAPLATLTSAVFAFILNPTPLMWVVMMIMPSVVVTLFGAIGLVFNLRKPNLNWENQTMVIKQSPSVMFTMFTSFGIFVVLIALYFALSKVLSIDVFALIALCLLVLLCFISIMWLKTKGVKKLENL